MKLHNIQAFVFMAFAMLLWAGNANANTIEALGGPTGNEELTCNGAAGGACLGFLGDPATLSAAQATGYDVSPSSPANEMAFLNGLLADVGEPAVSFVDKTDMAGMGFTTRRQYFSVKQGDKTWYFKNTAGAAVTTEWGPNDFSHYTEYGAVVPLPGAVWLLGSALLGLVGFARHSSKTA